MTSVTLSEDIFRSDFEVEVVADLPKFNVDKIKWARDLSVVQIIDTVNVWYDNMSKEGPKKWVLAASNANEFWQKLTADGVKAAAFLYGLDPKMSKSVLVPALVEIEAMPVLPAVLVDTIKRFQVMASGGGDPGQASFSPLPGQEKSGGEDKRDKEMARKKSRKKAKSKDKKKGKKKSKKKIVVSSSDSSSSSEVALSESDVSTSRSSASGSGSTDECGRCGSSEKGKEVQAEQEAEGPVTRWLQGSQEEQEAPAERGHEAPRAAQKGYLQLGFGELGRSCAPLQEEEIEVLFEFY